MTDTYIHDADTSYGYGTGYYGGYAKYNNIPTNDKNKDLYNWDSYDNWLLDAATSNSKYILKEDEFLCEDCGHLTQIESAEYISDFNAIVCKSCHDMYEHDIYTAQNHITKNQKQLQ
jgi:hypothetical protein